MRLLDRVALVTGGGSGIGRAIALRLADEGCHVGLLGRREEPLRSTVDAIERQGRRSAFMRCDVADRAAVRLAMEALQASIGPADVLVNNAGVLRFGTLLEMDPAAWHEMVRINVDGTLWCCQAVVPGMVARGRGRVVNVASWMGKKAAPCYGGYAATKAAVLALTQALALEVAGSGVTVNAVCPGMIVDTGMREASEAAAPQLGLPTAAERARSIPLRRPGYPADVAKLAAFLASDESDYMTGQAINVTGGLWMH